MSKISKSATLISESAGLKDRSFARQLRLAALDGLNKTAQDIGILQNPAAKEIVYETREHFTAHRGGNSNKELYGVGLPDHPKSVNTLAPVSRSLSTRYSPDRVGVQARRVSDGVYQDPITNKVYNWNEGFKTEDGSEFAGGSVDLQTDIMYFE